MTLAEALEGVKLEVGRTYVVQQRNQLIQVRVVSLEDSPPPPIAEDAPGEVLRAPCDRLGLAPAVIVQPTSQMFPFRRPFEVTEDDLTPGDLE